MKWKCDFYSKKLPVPNIFYNTQENNTSLRISYFTKNQAAIDKILWHVFWPVLTTTNILVYASVQAMKQIYTHTAPSAHTTIWWYTRSCIQQSTNRVLSVDSRTGPYCWDDQLLYPINSHRQSRHWRSSWTDQGYKETNLNRAYSTNSTQGCVTLSLLW